jgi:hypothetical protein
MGNIKHKPPVSPKEEKRDYKRPKKGKLDIIWF